MQAREYTNLMELWNSRAASAVIQHNKSIHGHDKYITDVHGLTRKEAIQSVESAIQSWYFNDDSSNDSKSNKVFESVKKKNKGPLKVITGMGMHSIGKKSVLLPSLIKYVRELGWNVKYQEGDGWFWILPS